MSAPLRALVVDDNAVNRQVLTAILNKLGIESVVVTCGSEAIEQAGATAFDLILMDLQMQGMTGLDATRTIRQAEKSSGHRAVIVAATAWAQEQDRQACLQAGMDDFVAKPFTGLQLQRVLGRWVPVRPTFEQH
jgi:CheY-like chemotaxis protein